MFIPSLLSLVTLLFSLYTLPVLSLPTTKDTRASDPCAAISGQQWVAPADVRACFTSFSVDPAEKVNVRNNNNSSSLPPTNLFDYYQIVTASTRILAFQTSVNYQIRAPQPFTADVHEDIISDLQRINETQYSNDLEFHIDISRSFKRLEDGHTVYVNLCYDGMKLR
jgi:hypothetical protein